MLHPSQIFETMIAYIGIDVNMFFHGILYSVGLFIETSVVAEEVCLMFNSLSEGLQSRLNKDFPKIK